jgi:hypothetical protein
MKRKVAKPKAVRTLPLKQRAAYLARPLASRPEDYDSLKHKMQVRADFLSGEAALARKHERDRIQTMIANGVSPQLRPTLLQNLHKLK